MAAAAAAVAAAETTVDMAENSSESNDVKTKLSKLFWHGGSAYDAWFSCASNQVQFLVG